MAFAILGGLLAWRPGRGRAAVWVAAPFVAYGGAAALSWRAFDPFQQLFDRTVWLAAATLHDDLLEVEMVGLLVLLGALGLAPLIRRRPDRGSLPKAS
jgi:hypothetical protein